MAPDRVHASLPLRGWAGAIGREILRGAELALEQAGGRLELLAFDASGDERDVRAEANARRAVADTATVAYLGDFHSSQVARSAPILSRAGLLQVAPAATLCGLAGSTLVRLTPDDRMLAAAIAAWMSTAEIPSVLIVHDHDEGYGVPMGRMCADAARERGLDVRLRPIWDEGEPMGADVAGMAAALYAGVAGSGAVSLWNGLHAIDQALWLLGTDGLAVPWLAGAITAGAAARTRLFAARHAPWGFYGYEAAAVIQEAVARADGDAAAAARAARATTDRDSVLGRYSVDPEGLTTRAASGRLAVVDGELVWDSPARM